ncbi:MAG: GNAT family N-acetyltransferase [Deltaproteobacteria bacterium]|nr:GNAT family N-acetyltransferase [Deltaproteobacteria bacterium]
MYEIREYISSDLSAVTQAFNAVVESGNAFMTEHPVSEEQMRERLKNEQSVFVAVRDGTVVGCYMLRSNMKGRGNHIANATYFVSENQRENGIGNLLGKHSISTAMKLGYKAMQFNGVVINNQASLRLWEYLGFEVIGKIPNGFRNKNEEYVDVCIMYKEL